MKFEEMADFIEEMAEHVEVKATHYLFDICGEFDMEEVKDRMAKLDHFIKWFKKECENDLIVPRGRQGRSYHESRKARQETPGTP